MIAPGTVSRLAGVARPASATRAWANEPLADAQACECLSPVRLEITTFRGYAVDVDAGLRTAPGPLPDARLRGHTREAAMTAFAKNWRRRPPGYRPFI
jgi:hypothetical protein